MSCLSVSIRRIGGGSSADVRRIGGMTADVERIGGMTCGVARVGGSTASIAPFPHMTARVGLVCTTNLDPREGILWASDGRLITLEGGYLIPNGR